MLPDGIIRTEMGVYVLRDDTHLSRWIENEGRLDVGVNISEVRSFAYMIPVGGVVVNAGACLGDHALIYSQLVGDNGRVYAFETHPLIYEALRRNMARLSNTAVFNFGLSDKEERVGIVTLPNAGASHVAGANGGGERGDVVPLDVLLSPARMGQLDFIHLDVEGMEVKALRGAAQLIERFHPAMSVEVCDQQLRRYGSSEVALLRFLDELGYSVVPVQTPYDPTLYDVLCTPLVRV